MIPRWGTSRDGSACDFVLPGHGRVERQNDGRWLASTWRGDLGLFRRRHDAKRAAGLVQSGAKLASYRKTRRPRAGDGAAECRWRGWWAVCAGNGTGWRPARREDPGATEDLNRLAYYRQTGRDRYYQDPAFNPWIAGRVRGDARPRQPEASC